MWARQFWAVSIEIYNINKNVKKYQRIFQKCRRAVFFSVCGRFSKRIEMAIDP